MSQRKQMFQHLCCKLFFSADLSEREQQLVYDLRETVRNTKKVLTDACEESEKKDAEIDNLKDEVLDLKKKLGLALKRIEVSGENNFLSHGTEFEMLHKDLKMWNMRLASHNRLLTAQISSLSEKDLELEGKFEDLFHRHELSKHILLNCRNNLYAARVENASLIMHAMKISAECRGRIRKMRRKRTTAVTSLQRELSEAQAENQVQLSELNFWRTCSNLSHLSSLRLDRELSEIALCDNFSSLRQDTEQLSEIALCGEQSSLRQDTEQLSETALCGEQSSLRLDTELSDTALCGEQSTLRDDITPEVIDLTTDSPETKSSFKYCEIEHVKVPTPSFPCHLNKLVAVSHGKTKSTRELDRYLTSSRPLLRPRKFF
jgi:hypothetical protein